MALFTVFVVDNRTVRYTVEAVSAEDAKSQVEESDDADDDFGHRVEDSSWYVDAVLSEGDARDYRP